MIRVINYEMLLFTLGDRDYLCSNTQDLYANKGLRFEKLSGKRSKKDQRSLRLNNQWRLIVVLEKDEEEKYILVIDIEDYH